MTGFLSGGIINAIPDEPVAKSDLIAWYPAENGASDETAGDSSFGDSTDYSGTVNGATENSSGGVTDILTQSTDSGYFEFDGSDDEITIDSIDSEITEPLTVCVWANKDDTASGERIFDHESTRFMIAYEDKGSNGFEGHVFDGSNNVITSGDTSTSVWKFHTLAIDSSGNLEYYLDANSQGTASTSGIDSGTGGGTSWGSGSNGSNNFDGGSDDLRVYNSRLSSTEIQDIYDATKP